nr:3682_t:CDS:2 [Entrophospora candida]
MKSNDANDIWNKGVVDMNKSAGKYRHHGQRKCEEKKSTFGTLLNPTLTEKSKEIATTTEAVLHTVTELLITESQNCLGFVDLIFGGLNYSISLNTCDLANFDKYIENEDESELLERSFMFWSKEHNETKLNIKYFFLSAEEQVTRHVNVIAHGSVQKRNCISRHPIDQPKGLEYGPNFALQQLKILSSDKKWSITGQTTMNVSSNLNGIDCRVSNVREKCYQKEFTEKN